MALRFGAHYTGETSKREVASFATKLETLGFDGFFARDGALGDDCLTILTTAAAVCDLDIGSAVLVMPFRNPVVTARTIATLDKVSGGRVILGVGVGGERLREFQVYDVEPKQRGPRTNESLDLMMQLWQQSNVDFEGRYFRTAGALSVHPQQEPHPPIWIGGRLGGQGKSRDAGLRRLARYGDGWLPYLVGPEQYAVGISRIPEYAAAAGRPDHAFTRALQVNIAIYRDQAEAMEIVLGGSARGYGLTQQQVERYYAVGSVSDVTNRLHEYLAAGVEYFVFQWACRQEDVPDNLELLSKEVIPVLRSLAPS